MVNTEQKKDKKHLPLWIGTSLLVVGFGIVAIYSMFGHQKEVVIEEPISTAIPTVTPTIDPILELSNKYDPLFTENEALNEDYVAYLEWENDLLYEDYEGCEDLYPHIIVKADLNDFNDDVNAANAKYQRLNFAEEYQSFGQDYMDAEINLDENGWPTDQNIIIYGHYVYRDEKLKFSPLHIFKNNEGYEDHDTFTLTFNGQQRTYKVIHAYTYNKSEYGGYREGSPFDLNMEGDELYKYIDTINNHYGDYVDTDDEIKEGDNMITLQTCVRNRDDQLFIVVAKEIDRVNF